MASAGLKDWVVLLDRFAVLGNVQTPAGSRQRLPHQTSADMERLSRIDVSGVSVGEGRLPRRPKIFWELARKKRFRSAEQFQISYWHIAEARCRDSVVLLAGNHHRPGRTRVILAPRLLPLACVQSYTL